MTNQPKTDLEQAIDGAFEVPGATPHFRTELAAQLAELVPEAVADGKLDVEKLRELLADDVADGNERFGLFWPGKKRALRAAQAPTTATLKPDLAHSKDWDTTQNVFIEGDNLEVLKTLQRHYHNKIKLIYIDPPYNTGKDFVYPDNFKEGLDTYLEWTRQVNEEGKKVSTNSETEGRYHSNWLNMMYPRLKLARNLLTDDGVIFISIDDNEQDNLKKLCNEILGEGNFVGMFKWNRVAKAPSLSGSIRSKYEYVAAYFRHDPINFFGKKSYNTQGPLWHLPNRRSELFFPEKSIKVKQSFDKGDYGGTYKVELIDDLIEEGGVNKYGVRIKAHSAWGQNKIDLYVKGGLTFEIKKNPTTVYTTLSSEDNYIAPSDLITKEECGVGTNTEASDAMKALSVPFEYPKPVSLIKYLINMVSHDNKSALILDFFAGSSTSAHAVMQLNAEDGGKRRFIMVQLPEPTPEESEARKAGFKTIADISRKRIELAGEKIKADSPMTTQELDTGFRAYKLADTNFSKWCVTSDVEVNELEQHLLDLRDSADDAAQADDLLTELLLKLGYSLTEPIHTESIAGLEVRKVGDNDVLAYLDEHAKPTLAQLRALVDAAPAKIIVLEDAFQGDDELKTNLAQHAKSCGIELWTA
ncbi:site-specific DNA-methyltransferase [Ferrovum myxofaciens]|uniref:site-specific DNA-methyltransferase n=1 Tax=Ferrovum myxofaciens TaxID=416213 RepID=UPI0023553FE7|nr:site-specific DNA-methyltransferase [Ferrovum myxofaciens]MBU6994260.1 site-specific DNA-methyltransferase [Ferrovum myxofaciens]